MRPNWQRWIAPLGRRLLTAVAAIALSVLLCFLLGQWAPGDAFTQLEVDPAVSPAVIAGMRARLSPDRSVSQRFGAWSVAALHGDFGYSLQFHRPVNTLLRERTPATLALVGAGLALAWILGLGLALLSAWLSEASRWRLERALRTASSLGQSALAAIPLGLLCVLALLLAPAGWLGADGGWPWVAVPVLALAFMPGVYFQAANALAAVGEKPFLASFRGAGVAPFRLVWRHRLPNTSDTLVPVAALTVSQALVETVIVESMLGWPGLGQLSLQAAAGRDLPLLAALVLWTSVLVVGVNLASDLIQLALNPRLRDNLEAGLA